MGLKTFPRAEPTWIQKSVHEALLIIYQSCLLSGSQEVSWTLHGDTV